MLIRYLQDNPPRASRPLSIEDLQQLGMDFSFLPPEQQLFDPTILEAMEDEVSAYTGLDEPICKDASEQVEEVIDGEQVEDVPAG